MSVTDTQLPSFLFSTERDLLVRASPSWRARFERLQHYVWDHLDQALEIEVLADVCALSPYHFHRAFRSVFGESLGHFVRRCRLLKAVDQLYTSEWGVTDIALNCGFSSSQALAKALKKQTDLTPTQVRQLRDQPMGDIKAVYRCLSPESVSDQARQVRQEQAERLRFVQVWEGERYFACQPVSPPSSDAVIKAWEGFQQKECALVVLSFDDVFSTPFQALTSWVGVSVDTPARASHCVGAGEYLCVRVLVGGEAAYFDAWNALLMAVIERGRDIDSAAGYIETIHNPATTWQDMDITLSLKLLPQE